MATLQTVHCCRISSAARCESCKLTYGIACDHEDTPDPPCMAGEAATCTAQSKATSKLTLVYPSGPTSS